MPARVRRLLPFLALAALAAAPALAEAPRRGGTLEFIVDNEPANYDCHANISFAFIHPVAPHYSTLLKFDGASYPEVKGDLAESWTVSPDQKTYTFKLRPNVLFHDGSKLTAADVKASYQRIIDPPAGVKSPRRAAHAAIGAIETPDPRTVLFKLQWPEASMLAGFASPWNCIYSAAKLAQDPKFPATRILGSGAYEFVEHVPGKHWVGKKFGRYFLPGRPYLDGYRATFMTGKPALEALKSGKADAQFRSVSPAERDELLAARGEAITVHESPWLLNLLVVFNTKRKPFDDVRVRRALSLAIDRWAAAESLSQTTYLKFVGGVMRPGYAMATPESALAELPGFSRDIRAARAEAARLLAEAGVGKLAVKLNNRNIAIPYAAAGEYLVETWRELGVAVTESRLGTKEWQGALESGDFDVSIDFGGDYFDDPTLQLAKYVSADLSPSNYAGSSDDLLDALYVGQAITADRPQRAEIVREFERRALAQAHSVPLLWWNRIVAHSARLRGWSNTPSHYIEQDLVDVWLDAR
jgi:peptide/nickel transport system substrate-binding protein